MKLHLVIALIAIIQFLSCVDKTYGRGGSHSSGGHSHSSGGHSHGGSSHPSHHHSSSSSSHQHSSASHSSPPKYGWNIAQDHSPSSTNHHSSAPTSEHISKTNAANVHSSNNEPFRGYEHQTGGSFGQQASHDVHNPSHSYHNNDNHPYSHNEQPQLNDRQSNGHGIAPGSYHMNPQNSGHSPPQTIIIHQSEKSSGPGFGQLAKEALIHSSIDTAVKASANRLLPGGINGHSSHGGTSSDNAASSSDATHTHITYNNYYNNGTSAEVSSSAHIKNDQQVTTQTHSITPAQNPTNSNFKSLPASSATLSTAIGNSESVTTNRSGEELKFISPSGRAIFKHELEEFSERLLLKDVNNAFKFITMKFQGRKMNDSVTDDAPNNFLTVDDEAWKISTIKSALALEDNYELNIKTNENVTNHERNEEDNFINAIVNTTIMDMTMKFLVEKGFVMNDKYEFKNALKQIWFTQFQRSENSSGSSGFETVFLAEKFNDAIIGLHNWIYYAEKEANAQLNYLGYISHISLGDYGAFVEVRSRLNGTMSNKTSLFVGTSPELEMSLYTLCFYISPNHPCPIKLAGNEFIIFITRDRDYGKDILVSADTNFYIPPPPPPTTTTSISTSTSTTPRPQNQPTNKINAKHSKSKSGSQSTIDFTKIHLITLLILLQLF